MPFGDLLGNGQAEAAAVPVEPTSLGQPEEPLEHLLAVGRVDAASVIDHLQHGLTCRDIEVHAHHDLVLGMSYRVVDQVGDRPRQLEPIAPDERALTEGAAHLVGTTGQLGADQLAEVDRFNVARRAGVEPDDREKVLHQELEPADRLVQPAESPFDIGFGVALREIELGAQGRDGTAQLVRDVSGESLLSADGLFVAAPESR